MIEKFIIKDNDGTESTLFIDLEEFKAINDDNIKEESQKFISLIGVDLDIPNMIDLYSNIDSCFREILLSEKRLYEVYNINNRNDNIRRALISYLYIKYSDSKYYAFVLSEDFILYGLLHGSNGVGVCKRLKLSTFLRNRDMKEETINKLLSEYIPNIKSLMNKKGEYKFDIIDICDGYNNTQISSCMQGKGVFFEYLRDELDNKLLVLYKNAVEVGRAILWNKYSIKGLPNECKGFIDKVYPTGNSQLYELFRDYATNNNYAIVSYNNFNEYYCYNNTSDSVNNLRIYVDIEKLDGRRMPYIDSFKYLIEERIIYQYTASPNYIEKTKYYLAINSTIHNVLSFDSQHGGGYNTNFIHCACCDVELSIERGDLTHTLHNGETICHHCFNTDYGTCEGSVDIYNLDDLTTPENSSSLYSYYYLANNDNFIEIDNKWYDISLSNIDEYLVECEYNKRRFNCKEFHYILRSSEVWSDYHSSYLAENEVKHSSFLDDYIHENEVYYSPIDKDYYPNDDTWLNTHLNWIEELDAYTILELDDLEDLIESYKRNDK